MRTTVRRQRGEEPGASRHGWSGADLCTRLSQSLRRTDDDEGSPVHDPEWIRSGRGGLPSGEGPGGHCSPRPQGDGDWAPDTLHLVARRGAYGGHPNPTRGNRANTFNRDHQSPVPTADPIECDFLTPAERGAITTFPFSTNGLAEYTASNLSGAMRGDLLTVGFDGHLYRLHLNEAGDALVRKDPLLKLGVPLDVTAQADSAVFPGTIWVADYASGSDAEDVSKTGPITVLEPRDYRRVRARSSRSFQKPSCTARSSERTWITRRRCSSVPMDACTSRSRTASSRRTRSNAAGGISTRSQQTRRSMSSDRSRITTTTEAPRRNSLISSRKSSTASGCDEQPVSRAVVGPQQQKRILLGALRADGAMWAI